MIARHSVLYYKLGVSRLLVWMSCMSELYIIIPIYKFPFFCNLIYVTLVLSIYI